MGMAAKEPRTDLFQIEPEVGDEFLKESEVLGTLRLGILGEEQDVDRPRR